MSGRNGKEEVAGKQVSNITPRDTAPLTATNRKRTQNAEGN
jgi:hypothetical protein